MEKTSPQLTSVGGYLLHRLAECGIRSVFGVPGNYNLGILDAVMSQPGMKWVGTATVQGAGYAADGYARLKGLGAIITTFGAGELSAMNAIAGAYAESVPVVQVVGTPSLGGRRNDGLLDDNLLGTEYGHFSRMAAEVTVAQADLRATTAPEQIDHALRTAMRTSLPVHIAVPADVAAVAVPLPEAPLAFKGCEDDNDLSSLFDFAVDACHLLASATSVGVLLGHLADRHCVNGEVEELVEAGDLPVAVLSMAKGGFPESDRHFAGLYAGAASEKRARKTVEDSDLLITVGVTLVDSITGGSTLRLPPVGRIDLCPGYAMIGARTYPGVGLRHSLAAMATVMRECPRSFSSIAPYLPRATDRSTNHRGPLTQQELWSSLQRLLQPGDLVFADQGTAFHGAAELSLPSRARLLAQPLWASIGWAIPAALGASLAAPDRRVVVIVGDGALQQVASELSKLLTLGNAPIIVVINNDGYTVERAIHRPAAVYHDIPVWDWTLLPATVAPSSSTLAMRAASQSGLEQALSAAKDTDGRPVLVEAVLGPGDIPPLLAKLARAVPAGERPALCQDFWKSRHDGNGAAGKSAVVGTFSGCRVTPKNTC
jgi:TPP-dependent 2-oxoacid decarboxylase